MSATDEDTTPADPAQAQTLRATQLVGQPGDVEYRGEAHNPEQWQNPAEAIAVAQVHATLAVAAQLAHLTRSVDQLTAHQLNVHISSSST